MTPAERPKVDYTREELIAICEDAIVQQEKWRDRDSGGAHVKVGQAWALLSAGCEFSIRGGTGHCCTDAETIWLDIWWHGFEWFEYGSADGRDEDDLFYLPTPARLEKTAHGDWY